MDLRFVLLLSVLAAAAASPEENFVPKALACPACKVYQTAFDQALYSVDSTYTRFLNFTETFCDSVPISFSKELCTEQISAYKEFVDASTAQVEQRSMCEILFGCQANEEVNVLGNFLPAGTICRICEGAAGVALDYFEIEDTIASGMEGARTLCKETAIVDTDICVSFVDASEDRIKAPTAEEICQTSGFCRRALNELNAVSPMNSRKFMHGNVWLAY